MAYEISERVKAFISLVETRLFSLDNGPILGNVICEVNTDTEVESTDVALSIAWADSDGLEFEEDFTFDEIDNATTDGEEISLSNTEGAPTSFRFYQVSPAPFDASLFNRTKSMAP